MRVSPLHWFPVIAIVALGGGCHRAVPETAPAMTAALPSIEVLKGGRWLFTYADMMTLMLALFMVLFSISSVNTSKFAGLQHSLQSAFSGKILSGGTTIKQTGGDTASAKMASAPAISLQAAFVPAQQAKDVSPMQEQNSLLQLKHAIQAAATKAHVSQKVTATISQDGLTVKLLTDGLLFQSGQAAVDPQALGLLRSMSKVLRLDGRHPLEVSGHTDNLPVHGQYPSNWELSTARASAVVRVLMADKVSPARMTATGRAFYDPVASDSTATGRAKNRRVEIFIPRMAAAPGPSSLVAAASKTSTTSGSGGN